MSEWASRAVIETAALADRNAWSGYFYLHGLLAGIGCGHALNDGHEAQSRGRYDGGKDRLGDQIFRSGTTRSGHYLPQIISKNECLFAAIRTPNRPFRSRPICAHTRSFIATNFMGISQYVAIRGSSRIA
jgi:hypothetical protein